MVALAPLVLLASAIGVHASPAQVGWVEEYAILKRDTAFPSSVSSGCTPFLIGQNSGTTGGSPYGNVCVTVDYSTHSIIVTYPTNPGGYLYTDEHVWIGCNKPTNANCNGKNPPANCDNSGSPGQFPYSLSGGQCQQSADRTSATCTINIDTVLASCDKCDQSFYIIAHASLNKVDGSGTVTTTATGVGQGTPYDTSPWFKQYFNPTFICMCTSTITFPAVTYSFTLASTTTVTSVSTTSYETTSTTVLIITTTSSSIYSTTEYSTTIYTSISSSTSLSESTPKSTATSTCHL